MITGALVPENTKRRITPFCREQPVVPVQPMCANATVWFAKTMLVTKELLCSAVPKHALVLSTQRVHVRPSAT